MKQDSTQQQTNSETLEQQKSKRWTRWARPKTDHQAPANLTESFMLEPSSLKTHFDQQFS